MRTFFRTLRIFSAITLFFFCWTYMPLYAAVAWAAEPRKRNADYGMQNETQKTATTGERFEKALEEIREKVAKAEEKAAKDKDVTAEITEVKKQRLEIEKIDSELRDEFNSTEKKLKDAKLPKEILDRHYKFVKHYEDNLAVLKANLEEVGKYAVGSKQGKEALKKAKAHLDKTKPPTKHVPLDPNKLPFRTVKAKERVPRLKKEEFKRDFPPQSHKGTKTAREMRSADFLSACDAQAGGLRNVAAAGFSLREKAARHKPFLVASNGSLTGLLPSNPELGTRNSLSDYLSAPSALAAVNAVTPNFELGTPNYQLALATAGLPTSDDLAETAEVQFTDELRQIATLLENNPVQLYEFVRNNFSYDPYYGSVKGSQSTLLLQSGNDLDQASVLIGLFRVTGIPARYVYGTVEIPIEKVMKWLGGVTKPELAAQILVTNGIPARLGYSGGTLKFIQLEHVWVEAYIPYANYRGLINDPSSPKAWIPLDPSFKFIEPNPDATDLADSQQFDIDSYLTSYLETVRPTTPAKEYLKNTIDYVAANMTGKRFYDLLVSNTITEKVLGLLPDTLSYPVKTIGAKFSAIPDGYRHRISLEFTAPNTNETILNYTASWTSVLHNRFTLSYAPATAADEQIIANYGDIYSTPSYLIKVKPVLKVEGEAVAEGVAVPMASDLTCSMNFIWPDGTIDKAVTNSLIAGAPYAIGLGSGYTTGRIVTNRTAKLEAAVNAGQTGEPIIGEYLNLFAVDYLQELDSSRKLIAKSMKTLDTNRTAELMVGVDLGVSVVFGIPKAVDIKGMLIDVDYNVATFINIDGDQTKVRRFQILAGMTSSALEHSIFEAIIGVEAVSTIKALEIANVQGIPVHQIDASNIAAKLPLLQLSSAVITDIQNAVNSGKVVTVSERNIQLNSWNGVGYVVSDPVTGAGAYMISGGMSGGNLTQVIARDTDWIQTEHLPSDVASIYIREFRRNIWFRSPTNNVDVTYDWAESRCRTLNNGQYVCRPHNGVDIAVPIGTTVFAVAEGQASSLDNPGGYGNYVLIDHGLGVYTLYGHLSSAQASGQVDEGAHIGLSGNTGESSGPHLHFSIFITDSTHPLYADGKFNFAASVNPRDFGWTFYTDGPPQ